MNFLRWLGTLTFLGWLTAIIFKVGNAQINNLLALTGIIFFIDLLYNKQKNM